MKRSDIYRDLTIASTSFATGCVLAVTVFNRNPWTVVALVGLVICLVATLMNSNTADEDEDGENATETQ